EIWSASSVRGARARLRTAEAPKRNLLFHRRCLRGTALRQPEENGSNRGGIRQGPFVPDDRNQRRRSQFPGHFAGRRDCRFGQLSPARRGSALTLTLTSSGSLRITSWWHCGRRGVLPSLSQRRRDTACQPPW